MAAILALSSGCYRTTYQLTKHGEAHEPGVTRTEWNHFFFWGLANAAVVNVPAICRHGASEVVIKETFATWMVSVLTLGIYAPAEVTVSCVAPGRFTSPTGAEVAGKMVAAQVGGEQ